MEFRVSRRGAAVIGVWCMVPGLAVCVPFWRTAFAGTFWFAVLWIAVCLAVVIPRCASCAVRVGGNHLTVRRGLLFLSTRRLPLRFITGCQILQTPLGRAAGVCMLALYASGTITLLPGIRRADAEALSARLTHGGKLL